MEWYGRISSTSGRWMVCVSPAPGVPSIEAQEDATTGWAVACIARLQEFLCALNSPRILSFTQNLREFKQIRVDYFCGCCDLVQLFLGSYEIKISNVCLKHPHMKLANVTFKQY